MKRFLSLALATSSILLFAAPIVKNGETIAFVGDSITQFGDRPDGYIQLVIDGLNRVGIHAKYIPAGVGGDRSSSILSRIDRVLAKKPDVVILKCGTNDVGWGAKGCTLEEYKANIDKIIDKCNNAGVRVVLVTPSMHTEHAPSDNNKRLIGYCDYLRTEAAKRKIPLADWNKRMREQLEKGPNYGERGLLLTIDHIHLNGYGNRYLAQTVLETLGIPAETVKSWEKDWNKIPSMTPVLNAWSNPQYKISIDDYEILFKSAKKQNMTVDALVKQLVADHIEKSKKHMDK